MNFHKFSSYGLLFACPFINEARDCPLHELRQHSINKRIKILNKMSKEKLLELESHHKKCLHERESIK